LEAAIIISVLLSLFQVIVLEGSNTSSRVGSIPGDEKKDPESNLEPTETKIEEENTDRAALVKKLRLQVCFLLHNLFT